MSRDTKIRFYDSNHLVDADITAPDGGSFPLANALDVSNRAAPYRPGTNQLSIVVDTGTNTNCSLFAMLGRANTPIVWSESAVVTIKGNNINLFDGTEPFTITATVTDAGVFAYLDTDSDVEGQQFRYWQIDIDDQYNPETIEIHYLFLGESFTFNRNISKSFSLTVNDLSLIAQSDSGRRFTRSRPQVRSLGNLGVQFLDYDVMKELLSFLDQLGTHTPFLVAIDPTEKCFDYEFSHYLCYFEQPPTFTHIKTNVFSTSFNLIESV